MPSIRVINTPPEPDPTVSGDELHLFRRIISAEKRLPIHSQSKSIPVDPRRQRMRVGGQDGFGEDAGRGDSVVVAEGQNSRNRNIFCVCKICY